MFVGRKEFLADLETLWRKRTSSIVARRGRRRIGKSTLFREFSRLTADCCIESVEADVERKVKALKTRRGVSVRTVLVYDGYLEPSVAGDGYFDAIVRAGQLLDGRA